jgi:phosphate transport system substrate-binding protein
MGRDDFADSIDAVSRRELVVATGAVTTGTLGGCLENAGTGNTVEGDGTERDDGDSEARLSGTVVVKGSSTVYPISEEMAQQFMDEHPGVTVRTDSTGSGGGFENHFCPGDADINGASRPIQPAEEDHCTENGVSPIEMHIAGDALTVAVSPDNDWVDSMTFDELARIWADDSATTWSDVDADWPDEELELYGPDTTSGTYDWFTANVNGGSHRTEYRGTEDDDTIVQALENSPYAMGYFGYAYYAENRDRVTALEIAESESDEPTAPSLEAATDGSYPLARPLFIYPAEGALQRDPVAEFVGFYLENSSADWIADEVGYVPSSDQQAETNLQRLEAVVGS